MIVGPTGVGKTKLSIELAKRMNAEIINGDSVSIYEGLDIGSAKPTKEERREVPHHLIDIRKVEEDYSVYDYQKDARKKMKEITERGKRVIIVGGTGLYIKAALYDYRFYEEKEKNFYEGMTNEELYEKIKTYTKENLPSPNNRRRLERLLQKLELGQEIEQHKDDLMYDIEVIGLTTDRDVLYQRINDRVDQMVKNGLLEEIEQLKAFYPKSRILNSGIGYKEFRNYLFENQSLEETLEEVKRNSRRFAKRQYTFFHHQFPTTWYDVDFKDFNQTIEKVYEQIKKEA